MRHVAGCGSPRILPLSFLKALRCRARNVFSLATRPRVMVCVFSWKLLMLILDVKKIFMLTLDVTKGCLPCLCNQGGSCSPATERTHTSHVILDRDDIVIV